MGMKLLADVTGAGISPAGIVNVCCGAEQVELTCTTSGIFQIWSSPTLIPNGHTIQSFGGGEPDTLPRVNSTTVTITRTSGPSSRPVVSRLSISPISHALNGTQVSCVDLDALNSSFSTIINIIMPELTEGKVVTKSTTSRVLLLKFV